MASSMKMMFLSCATAWLYVFGTCLILMDLLFCSFPLALIGAIILFIFVQIVKLNPPDPSKVEALLGQDPWIQKDNTEVGGDSEDRNSASEPYCMRVVAHRGAGLDVPENTLTAIRKCREKGCSAIEFDVALTKDNVPIVFHDDRIDRLTEQTGVISALTWNEVKELNVSAKHPFSATYPNESIPRLDEFVEECLKLGLRMFIDVKDCDLKIVPFILHLFIKHENLHEKAVVSSFYPQIIYLVRRANRKIVCSMAWRPYYLSSETYSASAFELRKRYNSQLTHIVACAGDIVLEWAIHNVLPYVLGLSAILVHKDVLSPEWIRPWRERNIRVIAWTVNLPQEKLYVSRVLKITYMTDTLDAENLPMLNKRMGRMYEELLYRGSTLKE